MTMKIGIILMHEERHWITLRSLLRQQSWLSPAFPIGSYSYSHGIEWAVEAGHIQDRKSLVDWLQADLSYGTGRNETIFFSEAWRAATHEDYELLFEISELAAAFRGTAEFALESSQQGTACLGTLRAVWPDRLSDWLSCALSERGISPTLSVVLGARSARQGIASSLALAAFLQSYIANLVTAGVRLIHLGKTA